MTFFESPPPGTQPMKEKRPLRRQPERLSFPLAHNAGSDGGRFPDGRLGGHKGAFCLSPSGSDPLKSDWQRHALACTGYIELGMFDAAALLLEEIAFEDKNHNEAWRGWLIIAKRLRQPKFMPISDESLNVRNFVPASTRDPIQQYAVVQRLNPICVYWHEG